ncbi:hypothetical protein SAMN05443574_1355 [Haloarcula vallismortis]|uniref:Uncharacterized protein n=2 Tax=Haloarcula vallismortis TaxID=28442 RepID=M0J966_HALVA|nr:hypothetical protein [Haloarcula vallismortis]EMA04280.1 hypothetical protein C437_14007 [Haloarcula vallismortis ATCC 29715]SDX35297.1 hypothetical protein SAMN05443574_1355 [Haloarcula vallismortis]
MSKNDLTEMSIAELRERKADLGDDDYGLNADHVDEELARRREERAREMELLDMKLKLEQAKDAGLTDDPTVQRIQEHVAQLEEDLHPDPRSDLAALAGVDEERVTDLSDSEVEQARTHLEAIDMVAGSSGAGQQTIVKEHREGLEELLDGHDLKVAELSGVPDVEERGVTVSDL